MSGEPPYSSLKFPAMLPLPMGGVIEFTGYTDIVLVAHFTDPNIVSYKAFSISRQQHVFIKTCGTKLEDITKLRHEWKIFQGLSDSMPGIIKPLALETSSRGLGLVFPWTPEMRPLNSIYLTSSPRISDGSPLIPLDLKTFLDIAAQMANILMHLHAAKVIHKNINPKKLLLNSEGEVYIHDFMIASYLEREETSILAKIYNPKVLEGTLAYLAPENTGRMELCQIEAFWNV
ncbi:kinase-like domain-containing protein [Endogone sp. FLAS-F59071]|nr:kinase-like domain-containing protein [Endogone sp. FLAS-F59071]|eukprot:RUS12580.1 kinase-like domain-containing protein [Endogone sp. FLAS-F59071]